MQGKSKRRGKRKTINRQNSKRKERTNKMKKLEAKATLIITKKDQNLG
jgi:hypothetical protein